jgi:hypothetical protein
MGNEIETGSATSGANGFEFEVVLLAAFGVDATLLVLVVAAGVVAFGVVTAGVATFGVEVDDAAPAGTKPTNSAAASADPPAIAPSVVRRFRLKA